ncbi:hypothetical protein [Rhodobacter sp. NSM]|uniref:hypothetical protein n=1 Tax=Rhodobacter sp. NSM TaxID=3457501 RepID=UPI003FD45A75
MSSTSTLAVIGRYILTPRVMAHLDRQRVGSAVEIQLTDAIAEEIRAVGQVYGFLLSRPPT